MKLLEEYITKEGRVYPGNVLKVDSFLNHQINISLLDSIGNEFYQRFKGAGVTRILTIEASGIAIACSAARFFKVPLVFAKKVKSLNIGDNVYACKVVSYTHGKEYDITLSRDYLSEKDNVLIVDDFLAVGSAMKGLIEICNQAGAGIAGIGICIEKGFQPGGDDLRKMGYDLMSLAIVDSMSDDGTITFRPQDD